MAVIKGIEVKSRIATCMLLRKLAINREYGNRIGIQDDSHYTNPAKYSAERETSETVKQQNLQKIKRSIK